MTTAAIAHSRPFNLLPLDFQEDASGAGFHPIVAFFGKPAENDKIAVIQPGSFDIHQLANMSNCE